MKKLYEFYWNCGRAGEIEGLFIAEEESIKSLVGEQIDLGEVLGKHSEVIGTVDATDITTKSEDQDLISSLEEIFVGGTLSGYNPLDYLFEDEDEEEE